MLKKRMGSQTVRLDSTPCVIGAACVAGRKEGEGPLGPRCDFIYEDTSMGGGSWEKAESLMQKDALQRAVNKAGVNVNEIDFVFAGDLLNQCIGTTFGVMDFARPFYGLYGACSTMAEGLSLAAMMIDGGFADNAAALTSSHFCSAERQYRLPLEYGGQRTPTSQWTVTGAGAAILAADGPGPYITHITPGVIVDAGVKDANNMGAAMAPAAYETIKTYRADTGNLPVDAYVTGDLGTVGRKIVEELFAADGAPVKIVDCGEMIFDMHSQDVYAGGSGCACSAVALCAKLIPLLEKGVYNSILFCGTGALLSPVSSAQGQSIPSVCHAVRISNTRG